MKNKNPFLYINFLIFHCFLIISLFSSHSLYGATYYIKATWEPSPDPDIREYRLYKKVSGVRELIGVISHPNTSYGPFPITVADGSYGSIPFVVTAVDFSNLESPESNPAYFNYDERIYVQFESSVSGGSEATSPALIKVILSRSSEKTITVNYSTSDGTAKAGVDYTASSGILTFDPGVTTQTISIPILNDTKVEENEIFFVKLSNPVNAILGSVTTHTYTITDDDFPGAIQFSSSNYNVNENSGDVLITVIRIGGSSGAINVNYATIDGTAIANIDYVPVNGTLNWVDGEAGEKTFKITIKDNSFVEPNKTFNLVLSNPTDGAILGTLSSATVTILNNDFSLNIPFKDDFSSDKGWFGYETGGWERKPVKRGGGRKGNPDPVIDHSFSADNYVLGFIIGEDYEDNLNERSIVSPPINCKGSERVFLKFWRWLNVEGNRFDHARVFVSNNGFKWDLLWENPIFNLTDDQWTPVVYDISQIAANQPTVYIKFTMGPTNSSNRFSGWNIDDLEITSEYSGPMALYLTDTPNPNIEEILIQQGFGIHRSIEIPSNLNRYSLLILQKCNSNQINNRIRDFIMGGGGVIVIGDCPKSLAGGIGDLSSIKEWFGALRYENDCGYGVITVKNPLGGDLINGEIFDYSMPSQCGKSSVDNLDCNALQISLWSERKKTYSFIFKYGKGRVFYYAGNPGMDGLSDSEMITKGLKLFEVGLIWAGNSIFSDLSSDFWAYDYIISIYNAGFTNGCVLDDPNTEVNEAKFCPHDSVSREQMAAFLVRALEGDPPVNYCDSGSPFIDVSSNMWSCRFIKRLKELGITAGYGDGRYGPYDFLTRAQMATFLSRAFLGIY